ncbi:TPA: DUF262 domain-containing protein [Aeromonas dhakensis]|nr:DUF262 domain-containing protein [Aeromonas dhakensis]
MNDTYYEEDDNQENEDDISASSPELFSSAVLSSNDWTTETIIAQINKKNIILDPEFQRRDAWDKKRKSKFIESLILGLPIPQIVLAESKDKRGSYIVLDGKQRLLSIRQFAAKDDDTIYNTLKLQSLEIKKNLNKMNLEKLKSSLVDYEDLAAFENQPIRTVVIKNWPNEDFLYHVFLRLNTGSVPLSPQELRQALHPGDFVTFLDQESSNSATLKSILNITKPDFRMRDNELLLRYFCFKNFLSEYTGSLKGFMDQCCNKLNKNWNVAQKDIEEQLSQFEQSHETIINIFSGDSYRKFTSSGYEKRFNRAIFDIMIIAFSDPGVRDASIGHEHDIRDAFNNLCVHNNEFKTAIETTTKSITATHTRLSLWFSAINVITKSNIYIPSIVDNRIQ